MIGLLSLNVAAMAVVFGTSEGVALQTSATQPADTATPTVHKMTAEVVQVQGNDLIVKLGSGDIQVFNVAPERRFKVDGTSLTVGQLKPGTMLTATYTSTPPVGVAVATVTGTVWRVMGNTVLLTHPDGTTHKYVVPESFRFTVDNRPATVGDLRPGMKVTANRIPRPPAVEFRPDIEITGTTKK
jgi:hypothetical protein